MNLTLRLGCLLALSVSASLLWACNDDGRSDAGVIFVGDDGGYIDGGFSTAGGTTGATTGQTTGATTGETTGSTTSGTTGGTAGTTGATTGAGTTGFPTPGPTTA